MYIYSYNMGDGSKALASKMGIKRIKHHGSSFKGSPSKTVVNWGSSECPPEVMKCRVINPPEKIKIASNKLTFFQTVTQADTEVSLPEWTQYPGQAEKWLQQGFPVCARTILNGHSANGLVLMEKEEDLVVASLYTKYFKKEDEYRVHVINSEVVDVQRKARKNDVPDDQVNWQIRNLANGFIYARTGFTTPETVRSEALKTIQAVGLDFGAVDVLWNSHHQKAVVLEVNTAPGLQGTTVELYAEKLREI